ncbi:hypothetical protein ALC57_16475 [Trachymyrmex cornetzi]|uniref:DNA-directed DNA polymerase n=1 Tax=Trachymyrmex cornetzi TaxID=471704 RepID=A0A151IV37_9HYME|nr:hypothetical protein ALC57_16475 [Trachymyrmex cornetzi]
MNALFASTSKEQTDGISQCITKLENGHLYTVGTPEGQTGHQLIRLDEVAVLKNGSELTYYIFTYPMPWHFLTKADQSHASWVMTHHHGLRWNDGMVPYRTAQRLISEVVGRESGAIVYVKGFEKGGFSRVKTLSRLIGSQLSKSTKKKHLCDRCLHYFPTSEKLSLHIVDCTTTNECAIILPNENDKWLSFRGHNKKERLLFVVYADLECILAKKTTDENMSRLKLRFVDSFKFLNTSLEKLVSYLDKSKLKIIRSEFSNLDAEDFDLLTRKGVFPYEYIDSVDKLNETSLPPRELFYSSLTDETASDDDYQHATNVWRRFCIETLCDYSDLYLKTNVLLLADVFENFRDTCIESYRLDPAYYYTLPGYTWDAMLKYTGIRFELLTDIDMVMFVERGVRGGLSQCSHRYAQANNKYNVSSYNPSEPSTYLIMYFDVNNLYGWAMSESLSYGESQWVDDIEHFDVMSVSSDSVIGYILKVDLAYPQSVHDAHIDLPFCPTRE